MKPTFKSFLTEMNYGSLVNKEKYNSLDDADKQLYKYTADGFTFLDDVIDELQERYPFKGGVLYRGLHFDSQEQHDELLEKIEAGDVNFAGTSSWTPNKSTAQDFARTKKTYFPTPEIMKAERDRNTRGDHMTGYGGIVITTKVKKNVGCDVNESEFAKESEVLLPPGKYKVAVEELVEPYKRKYDSKEKVAKLLKQIKNAKSHNSETSKLADYVVRSWFDQLEPEEVDVIAEYAAHRFLTLPIEELKAKCITFEVSANYFKKSTFRLELDCSLPLDEKLYDKCSPKMKAVFDKRINVVLKRLDEVVKKLMDHEELGKITEFRIDGIKELRAFGDSKVDKAIVPLKKFLGSKYHELNSREVNKSLKTMDDIRAHGETLQQVLQAITKL